LISTHSLSIGAFTALAVGAGDSVVVGQLRDAQLSKHLMLLHVVTEAVDGLEPSPATAAFRAGYQLLAKVQAAHPGAVAALLGMPHVGSWAHNCLAFLDRGSSPDLGYLAAVAAAAAIRTATPFELDVPVGDGVLLPGLGCLQLPSGAEWIRLRSDGDRLRAGDQIDLACAALVPDDGSGATVPHWRGTPLIRAVADGQAWEVLLETADRQLDRYALPMLTGMAATEVASWRHIVQSAWDLLVRHHAWAAGPIAAGVSVIVPLVPRSDLDSATSPAAFGAIATSMPPSRVSMAETIVHEFQHTKLCALTDLLPLTMVCADRGYAPWREDPRPMGGMLQGVYAHAGIVRFWDVQRRLETGPDDRLRASVLYERWRSTIGPVADALLGSNSLTAAGNRLVTSLSELGRHQDTEPVPAEAVEIAREIALDNWLTWQLRHEALDRSMVAGLAAAYQRGEQFGGRPLPESWIEDDIRKVDSIPRSRLLNMRGHEPRRFRQLSGSELLGLSAADALLVRGNAEAAVAAYRDELIAEPDPATWIGLSLAIHRLPESPARALFATNLAVFFEVHACLADQGIHADPLDVAAWFE
jgi:HEXXH motif-containing protein